MNRLYLLVVLSLLRVGSLSGVIFKPKKTGIRRVSDVVDEIPDNVDTIDLANNDITRLYNKDFIKFRSCRTLILRDNKINTIDVGAFEGLRNLETLSLVTNKLAFFPNLTDVQRLIYLDLGANRFSGTLQSEVQVLEYNILTDISFNKNDIVEIPAEFLANFPRLKTLSVIGNRLTRIPQLHSVAGNLEKIYIGDNPIQTGHSSDFVRYGQKSVLNYLSWSSSDIPGYDGPMMDADIFSNLDSLKNLYLNNQNLQKLPDLSKVIDTLETVMINTNPKLDHLDPTAFFGDPLDYNKEISVKQLTMDSNRFRTIPADFLKALKNVESISFINNIIDCFPMSALKELPNLRAIYLEHNRLQTVEDIGHRGRRSFRVDVSGNELACDRRLCWLFESTYFYWNEHRVVNYFSEYPCYSPPEAATLTYEDLSAETLGCNGTEVDFKANCSDTPPETSSASPTKSTSTTTSKGNISAGNISVTDTTSTYNHELTSSHTSTSPVTKDASVTTASHTEHPEHESNNGSKKVLPDGFWIFLGIIIIAVPIVFGVFLYNYFNCSYRCPVNHTNDSGSTNDNRNLVDPEFNGQIPEYSDVELVNNGAVYTVARLYFDFMSELEQR